MDFPTHFLEVKDEEESQQSGGYTETQPSTSLGNVDHGLLIEAIQGYPYLFDVSHKHYKDAKKKTLAWQHVAELLNCAVEDCMRAWKNLRDRFVKEKNKLASGAGASKTNWPFYELMLFYGKFTKPRKNHTATKKIERSRSPSRPTPISRPSSSASTLSSLTYDTIMSPEGTIVAESQASEENDEAPGPSQSPTGKKAPSDTPATSFGPTRKRKRSLHREDDDVSSIMGVTKTIVSKLDTRVPKNVNTTFGDYICQELEKLSEVDSKKKRKKILAILFDDDDSD